MSARTDAAAIDQSIRRLTAITPRTRAGEEVALLRRFRQSAVAEAVVRQRVLIRALRAINEVDQQLSAEIEKHVIVQWRRRIVDVARSGFQTSVDRLSALARQLGMPIWLTRGAAALARDGFSSGRDLGDIDLMVRTSSDAYALAAALSDRLVPEPNELPWLKGRRGSVIGEINLHDPTGQSPNLDIHFGGYPVRHCAALPLPVGPSEPGVHVCDRTVDLAYLIANASNDHAITAKDLNELHLALGDDSVDWTRLLNLLDSVTLSAFLGDLLAALRDAAALTRPERAHLAQIEMRCGTERFKPISELLWPSHWRQRWFAHIDHAFRHFARRSWLYAAFVALDAARFHRTPIRTDVVPTWRARPPRLRSLRDWTVVFLVPASTIVRELGHVGHVAPDSLLDRYDVRRLPGDDEATPIRVLLHPAGDLVIANDLVFVPSTYRKIPRALASALRA